MLAPSRFTLPACAAAALLAGCALRQAQGDNVQGGIPPLGVRAASWMSPAAKRGDLLYVATGDNVYVLSYPVGKVVGGLGVTGNNLCSDKHGNVFVPTNGYQILEYAHGGMTPIQTLASGDIPLGCAVDPVTGNLAVTQEASGAGEVAIFRHAKGQATWYRDPDISTFGLCGYDDRGDLFVDGAGSGNVLAELPKGGSTFANYALGRNFDVYGSIQWDGLHVTLANPTLGEIDRLAIGKTSLKVVGRTRVRGWHSNYYGRWPYIQTWLQDGTFIAQSSSLADVGLWRYPAGGKAAGILGPFRSGNTNIYGVTVSLPPE
ncbi:MAG TPA: hypothetical protein VGI19_15880 [Candidatus Cybelea sp.]|jgi:hypothetical protein